MEVANKPRRLEDDVAEYLDHIENDWIGMTESRRDTEMELMVTNVLDEVKNRLASAACDRRTHPIIEKLAYVASMSNLIIMFDHLSVYGVFLARNRHSSHVLQAILARFSYLIKNEGTGGMDMSRVATSVLSLVEPIIREISWLSMDLCASHVVRSALCVLTGMPVIGEKRSKHSRHQHSVGFTEPMDSLLVPNKLYIDENVCFSVPGDFQKVLNKCLHDLCTPGFGKPGEGGDSQTARAKHTKSLHTIVEDSSGCAVFGLILRICYNPNILMDGPRTAEQLIRVILEWPNDRCMDLSLDDMRGAVFYRLSGNKSASYFLEALIECCDLYFVQEIVEGAVVRSSEEYANDPSANFILQSILKRYCIELERYSEFLSEFLGKGNSVKAMGKSQKDVLKILGKQSTDLILELSVPSLFSSLVKCKAGLVFWVIDISKKIDALISIIGLENAEKYKLNNGTEFPNRSGAVCHSVLSIWVNKGESLRDVLISKLKVVTSSHQDGGSSKRDNTKQSESTPSSSSGSGSATSFTSIPILTCKILGAMQSLSIANADIKETVFDAISALPLDTLTVLSLSGPMSKATLDAFFENCKNNELVTRVIETLSPKLATLAGHYIGQHIVKKMFESTDVKNKESILNSLMMSKDYLGRTKEGRNSIRILGLDLYQRSEEEWRKSLKRQERATAMITQLEQDIGMELQNNSNTSKERIKHDAESDENHNKDDEIVESIAGKTKRKRKRNRGDPLKKKVATKITF